MAAAFLQGRVEAERFAQGEIHQVIDAAAALRERPEPGARLESELLLGETFTIYDISDGYAWGQSGLDSYVGYVATSALIAPLIPPTHRVKALRTYMFAKPDLKSAPLALVSLNSKVAIERHEAGFAKAARFGWIYEGHLAPIDSAAHDWVAVAEQFVGAPYLWGGKQSLGLDCSGLVQTALEAAGIAAPRDADLQENALGRQLPLDFSALARGDLIFWNGHVGLMLDGERLLHANAFHMATHIEKLSEAMTRIGAIVGPVRTIRRL